MPVPNLMIPGMRACAGLKLPSDIPVDYTIFNNEKAKRYCFDISDFKVSDDFLSFQFKHSSSYYACIHNRQTSRSYVYKSLMNDINLIAAGFVPFCIQGKTLYFVSDAETVFNHYSLLKNSSEEEHRRMADRFLKSVGGHIDEMDNPYIVAVTCK